jgi:hypothetical protein
MSEQLFHYYLGIDLGQARDYTALSLVEEPVYVDMSWAGLLGITAEESGWRSPAELRPDQARRALYTSNSRGRPPHPALSVRHLERFELGTRYPKVIERVQELLDSPPLEGKKITALVDATGVGRAVVDSFFQAGLRPTPVTIHGGEKASRDHNGFRVPKRDLVSAVQVLLQNQRLKIAGGLSLAEVLKKELLNFRVKIDPSTAHDSYSHWREGDHDDLVLATAMACWARQWWMHNLDKHHAREWKKEGVVMS